MCRLAGIRSWDQFKNSERKKTFFSPKLKRDIKISGDKLFNPEPGTWKSSELEWAFKNNFSTDELDRVDKVKEMFHGELVCQKVDFKRGVKK